MAIPGGLIGRGQIPGSGQVMKAYSRVLGGNADEDLEDEDYVPSPAEEELAGIARGNVEKFMSSGGARGQLTGKQYSATPLGFQGYLSESAAYQLDQGPRGAARAAQIAKAFAR